MSRTAGLSNEPKAPKSKARALRRIPDVSGYFATSEPLPAKVEAAAAPAEPAASSAELSRIVVAAGDMACAGDSPRLAVEDFLRDWTKIFKLDELYTTVLPSRTLARRKAKKEPLSVEETDKALRLARVAAEAERVFGTPEKSLRWLRKPNRVFSGLSPLGLLATETGSKAVEQLLGQIDHGMFI